MNGSDNNPDESNATKEVAVAATEAMRLTEKFGNFVSEVFGPSIKDIGEVAHLSTQYWKLKNAIKYQEKVEKLFADKKVEDGSFVPPRIGLPIVNAVMSEDNDNLQDMWANLTASALGKKSSICSEREFIETLKRFDPKDAENFEILWNLCISSFGEEDHSSETGASTKGYLRFMPTQDELINFWTSLRTLERLQLISLKSIEKSDEIERNDLEEISAELFIMVAKEYPVKDGPVEKKEDTTELNLKVHITDYGCSFAQSVLGSLYEDNLSLLPLAWDDFVKLE